MKHDIIIMGLNLVKKELTNAVSVAIIDDAIEVVKAHAELEKEHKLSIKLFNTANEKLNSLEIDVKRYFELLYKNCELHEIDEYYDLQEKLSKAGKEE